MGWIGRLRCDSDGFDFFRALEFDGSGLEEGFNAAEGEFFGEMGAGDGIELFGHEAVGTLQDGDMAAKRCLSASASSTPSRPPPVDDGMFAGERGGDDGVGVAARAQREDVPLLQEQGRRNARWQG